MFAIDRVTRRACVALAAVLASAADGQAAFTMRLSPSSGTIDAGGTATVRVQLVSDGAGGGDVAGFTAGIYLDGAPAGLRITSAVMPSSNYLFEGNSFVANNPGLIDFATPLDESGAPSSFPSPRVSVFDLTNDFNPLTIGANQTYDLAVLTLTAAADLASATYTLRFDTSTSILDGASVAGFKNTDIQVLGPTPNAVPAPPSIVLMALGCVLLTARRLRAVRPRSA